MRTIITFACLAAVMVIMWSKGYARGYEESRNVEARKLLDAFRNL